MRTFIVIILLGSAHFTALGQAQKLLFGGTVGTGLVTSSYKNWLSFNQEIGLSVRYVKSSSPFELQVNTLWCRRSVRGVFATYNRFENAAYYSFKPIYGCFENALQVNYILKDAPDRRVILTGGVGYNFVRMVQLKERFWSRGSTFMAPVEGFADLWNDQRMSNLSLIIGVSVERQCKRSGRPYTWTIQYQKTTRRAPNFSYQGTIQINEQIYAQDVSIDPFLDALSVRFTYYPFSVHMK